MIERTVEYELQVEGMLHEGCLGEKAYKLNARDRENAMQGFIREGLAPSFRTLQRVQVVEVTTTVEKHVVKEIVRVSTGTPTVGSEASAK